MEKFTYETIDGELVATKNPQWERLQNQKRLSIKYRKAGIAESKWKYSFDDYKGEDLKGNLPKLKKFVDNFDAAKGVHLFLWSKKNSTQKSTMASIVAMELLQKGYKVRFLLMSELVPHLTNEQFKEESQKYVAELSDIDFLVIDDSFDDKVKIYKSGYQISFIDSFLRQRLEVEGLNTCFTSNTPIESIGEKFDRHIQALLERTVTPFHFDEPINDFNPATFWDD